IARTKSTTYVIDAPKSLASTPYHGIGMTMTTDRQIAANRRDALKSTDPRTADGLARSSRNALKHGAYAHHLPLTPEDRAGLRAPLASYHTELRSVSPLQRAQPRFLTETIHCLQPTGLCVPASPRPGRACRARGPDHGSNLSALNYLARAEARF